MVAATAAAPGARPPRPVSIVRRCFAGGSVGRPGSGRRSAVDPGRSDRCPARPCSASACPGRPPAATRPAKVPFHHRSRLSPLPPSFSNRCLSCHAAVARAVAVAAAVAVAVAARPQHGPGARARRVDSARACPVTRRRSSCLSDFPISTHAILTGHRPGLDPRPVRRPARTAGNVSMLCPTVIRVVCMQWSVCTASI